MSKTSAYEHFDGVFHFPLRAIMQRIDRRLKGLVPKRELYYKHHAKDYYIRTLQVGHPEHLSELGPVYYSHMIALADHLDLWQPSERALLPKLLMDNERRIFAQDPLPRALAIPIMSQIETDALAALRGLGYTMMPSHPKPIIVPPSGRYMETEPPLVLPPPALQITNYKLDDAVPEECMPHSPREHHPMCNSWHGGECDCQPLARDGLEPA